MSNSLRYIIILAVSFSLSNQLTASTKDSVRHQLQLNIGGNYLVGYGVNHNLLIYQGSKYFSISNGFGSSSSPYSTYLIYKAFSFNQEFGIGFNIKRSNIITGLSYKLDVNFKGASSKYSARKKFLEDHPDGSAPYNPTLETFFYLFCKYQYNFKRCFVGLNLMSVYSYSYYFSERKLFPFCGVFIGFNFKRTNDK